MWLGINQRVAWCLRQTGMYKYVYKSVCKYSFWGSMLHLLQWANHPTNQTTHSMEQRPSQDVHNSFLKQVSAVHSLTFYFLNIRFNIMSIRSSKWSCGFSNQNVVIHLLPLCALCVQPDVIYGSYSVFNYTLSVNSTKWCLNTNLLN